MADPTQHSRYTPITMKRSVVAALAVLLAVAIALRSTYSHHLEHYWKTMGSTVSSGWAVVYRLSGESSFNMHVIASVLQGFAVFVIVNSFFGFLDLTGRPKALLKYKIQEEKAVPVNWQTYKKTLKRTLFNALVPSSILQVVLYPLIKWRGMSCDYELPAFTTALKDLIICAVVVEICFFYLHWLFHHPKLYKYVHKTHHEWTAPVGVASIYCHPLEHFLVNLVPVVAGPIVAGSHLAVGWLWFSLVVISTTINHSGYHFPFFPSAEWHDFHHAKFNQCFGVFGVLDYIHGTDNQFRSHKAYERHTLLLGLKSARELYPDPTKPKKPTPTNSYN